MEPPQFQNLLRNLWVPDAPANLHHPSLFGKKKKSRFLFIEPSHLLATLTFFLMKLCVSLPPEANMKK